MSNQMRQEHVFGSLDVDLEHDPSLGQSPDPGGDVEGLGPQFLVEVDMGAVALEMRGLLSPSSVQAARREVMTVVPYT